MAIALSSAMALYPGEIMSKRGLSGRWFVKTLIINNKAIVYPTQYGNRWDKATVVKRRESVFDLLLGRTWETKFRSAQIKWQRYCDRMNERLDRDVYIAQRYKGMER